MVGGITFPATKDKGLGNRPRVANDQDFARSTPASNAPSLHPASYLAETMTTTVTTTTQTTQTTHFFSLPLWRRPNTQSMSGSSSRTRVSQYGAGEDGFLERPKSFNFDKDLPAVPFDDVLSTETPLVSTRTTGEFSRSPLRTAQTSVGERSLVSESAPPTRRASPAPPSRQTTRALAQASLGLGLPHIMPHAAASSTSPSLASLPGSSGSTRPTDASTPLPDVRRAKSFSRTHSEGYFSNARENRDRRHEMSLLPANAEGAKDAKGKGKESGGSETQASERKPVVRRPSFWNRRRVQSMKTTAETASAGKSELLIPVPMLPVMPPVSPLFGERASQSSDSATLPSQLQSPGLRRRHSERSTSHRRSTLEVPEPPPPLPKRSPYRPPPPNGADLSPSSPTLDRLPRQSTELVEPRPTASSPHVILSPAPHARPGAHELARTARPRSMTNPGHLLHRLSLGLFTPSSSSSPVSSPTVSTNITDDKLVSSPTQTSPSLPRSSLSKSAVEIPKPRTGEESPEVFLRRLEEAVSKAEIANILAARLVGHFRLLQAN